jgi:hypothetical protein
MRHVAKGFAEARPIGEGRSGSLTCRLDAGTVTIAGHLCSRGRRKELDIASACKPHGAYWPAVHARRAHSVKKRPS